MPVKRSDRVGALLQAALSELILREVKDPRVGMVTVTGVELSADLKHARVFVSVLGDAPARARTLAGLSSARSFLQSHAGKRLGLRFTPELRFEVDPSFESGDRIERLLREIHGSESGSDVSDAGEESGPSHPPGASGESGPAHIPNAAEGSGRPRAKESDDEE
jgi:ribosome-binding factor A